MTARRSTWSSLKAGTAYTCIPWADIVLYLKRTLFKKSCHSNSEKSFIGSFLPRGFYFQKLSGSRYEIKIKIPQHHYFSSGQSHSTEDEKIVSGNATSILMNVISNCLPCAVPWFHWQTILQTKFVVAPVQDV